MAKNQGFQDLAARIAAHVEATRPADVPAALASVLGDGATVQEAIEAQSAVIGEKLELRRLAVLDGQVATYLHKKDPALPPQVGVLVQYTGTATRRPRRPAGRPCRSRPCARGTSPGTRSPRTWWPASGTSPRRRPGARASRSRPSPKIVEGRVNAFFKDAVLLEQPSVQDSKKTVAQVLADAGVTVSGFARFEVGAS